MNLLESYRENAALTLEKASEILDVDKSTLSRWERGINRIPASALPKIKKAYGLTDRQLLQLLNQAGAERKGA